MADSKPTPAEETKWWIERGPRKEREQQDPEKSEKAQEGLIERWAFELLKDYNQEQALRNVVDINQRTLSEMPGSDREWGQMTLGVGKYPPYKMRRIREALRLPSRARALAIDAGYSVRVLITGEPVGERLVDINFTESPSMDYWVRGELMEERLFSTLDEALKVLGRSLANYLRQTD